MLGLAALDQVALCQLFIWIAPTPPPEQTVTGGRQIEEWEVSEYLVAAENYKRKVLASTNYVVSDIAAELGKLGGLARAKALTPTQRSNIASKAAQTRWR